MVLISKYMVPNGYVGIAIFPFIFLKHASLKSNRVLINHERIHLRQQLELLLIPFYLLYAMEFLYRLLTVKNWQQAYQSISFEKEAFENEDDFDYLASRPLFHVIKYL